MAPSRRALRTSRGLEIAGALPGSVFPGLFPKPGATGPRPAAPDPDPPPATAPQET